jgi:nitroimidazol reductase NimA-like FMN-containing flavoprotein (pyridoxamine 5'-phosphate oxidase superfamily)
MPDTDRTRFRRKPKRGSHQRKVIEAILDAALVSHLGVVDEVGHPVVIPTLHVRSGPHVYLHGSARSRALGVAGSSPACLTATLLDGLVLSRAALHHSVNYRSAMLFGRGEEVEDEEGKMAALEALTEKLIPGRWADVRAPSERELRTTSILRMPIEEASAKVRRGPPVDEAADRGLAVWAGVVGLRLTANEPEPDPDLAAGIERPGYLVELLRSLR